MFYFKSCPRCSGDLFQDSDTFGPYVNCAQCGFHKDIPDGSAPMAMVSAQAMVAELTELAA